MQADILRSRLPVADLFVEEYLAFHQVLPLEVVHERLHLAIAGEPDPEVLQDLERTYGVPLEPLVVPADQLREAVRLAFAAVESVVELVRDLQGDDAGGQAGPEGASTDVRAAASQPPVVRFVNLLLRDAHAQGASDIHLEGTRDGLRVRLRLDGVLHELPGPPPAMQAAVISRLKLLAELDIAERRMPQDGRIRVRLEAREMDLRVSTVPTLFGESVVLRLLDRGGRPTSLEELGMTPAILAQFDQLARRPHGILLATGPTGSGKTTTLYAALSMRRAAEEKIVTVEDPIEYHLQGITQVPVQPKAGMTFAAALRSILRQDPDVLMVGEMRDPETTAIAVQAAMTGHLVLSTLHTNDAVGALTRLVDLGVEPYMVAATVEAILAQRLVRRICDRCRARYEPEPGAIALVTARLTGPRDLAGFERGLGCEACRNTGYRGRLGLFELLILSDDLRRSLIHAPDVTKLRTIASEEGLVTLRQDGWAKVQAGLTTVEEVARVVQA